MVLLRGCLLLLLLLHGHCRTLCCLLLLLELGLGRTHWLHWRGQGSSGPLLHLLGWRGLAGI